MRRLREGVVTATCSARVYNSLRCSSTSQNITRPPSYRKPHQHHKPKHMLQEEFPNAGDAAGVGVRLFDYYKTAEMVNQLPTIQEKIDFVSPYERPWTAAEKTWRRDWHPSLMATRKAWALPRAPAYFDCLRYYQYITKTRVNEESLDDHYKDLVPPTDRFEKALSEALKNIMHSTRFDSEEERVNYIISTLIDEGLQSLAHNMPRLADYRIAYDSQNESFWIRSGFMFLYDFEELGKDEVHRKLHNAQKFIGDDRRKLGELAFVSRDKFAAHVRSVEQPSPLFSLESTETNKPIFSEDVDVTEDVLFSPKVMNLWPDEKPLWQTPGYFVDSGETHMFGRLAGKSLHDLNTRLETWNPDEDEREVIWFECAKAQAVSSLFTTLCAQAHTHGFTQYTDVTRPFSSQMILSDGQQFVFAVGQLNTLAINIECEGFENNRSNYCQVEKPMNLFDTYKDGEFYHYEEETVEGETKKSLVPGLNRHVLSRTLQMIMKD
ncbi:unnamed protein product [Auanema sp. JU1783]|nr:unnamed protein product [Auanema sp. JU1783]